MPDSHEATILTQFPGPVELSPSRRKWLAVLAGCLVFAALGVFELTIGALQPTWAWVVIVVFGVGGAVAGTVIFLGGGLRLDDDGFVARGVFGRSVRGRWATVSGFQNGAGSLSRIVLYDDETTGTRHARLAAVANAIAGHANALPDTYGFRAADLARLLNAWRALALRERKTGFSE